VREEPGVELFRRVGGDGARVPRGVGVAGRVGRRLVAGETDEIVLTECLVRVRVRARARVRVGLRLGLRSGFANPGRPY
jgi:hypothetical protein